MTHLWRGAAVLGIALLGLTALEPALAATAYTTTQVNLRRAPLPDALVLKTVPGDTLLTVACAGQWCRTSYQGRGGYVYRPLMRPFTRSAPLSGVFYASCATVRAQGKAPIRIGHPGYRTALDSNSNALACDPGDR